MSADPIFYPHAVNLFTQLDPDRDLDPQLAPLRSVPPHKKILLWSVETLQEDLIMRVAHWTRQQGLDNSTVWWLQPSHQYAADVLTELGQNVFLIDIDLLNLQLHLAVCEPNPIWHADTGRFLFLTGKPDKHNRIRLLWKFHVHGLLPHCDWSLFVDEHTRTASRQLVPELSDIEFEDFVAQHQRHTDEITLLQCTSDSIHCHGYPFNAQMYQQTSFRVISETMMLSRPITSEKTWITMINRMPFIMSGYAHSLSYLKKIGYRTFEQYLAVPHYDEILDLEQRLDAVVTNTKFWLDHVAHHKDSIEIDVEHNYRLLCEHMLTTHDQVEQLAAVLGEPQRPVSFIVPLTIEQHQWINFYYNIKDPGWPDCLLEQNFQSLPPWIQQECTQQFGYQPKNNH